MASCVLQVKNQQVRMWILVCGLFIQAWIEHDFCCWTSAILVMLVWLKRDSILTIRTNLETPRQVKWMLVSSCLWFWSLCFVLGMQLFPGLGSLFWIVFRILEPTRIAWEAFVSILSCALFINLMPVMSRVLDIVDVYDNYQEKKHLFRT